MNVLLGLSVLTIACASASIWAAEEPRRLIETRPGHRFWSTREDRENLSRRAHEEGRCGGFMDITDYPIRGPLPPQSFRLLAGLEPKEQANVLPLIREADEGNLISVITHLSAFEDRNYQTQSGVQAAEWIKDQYTRFAGNRPDIKVELVKHRFRQPSVIATIQGSGPARDEIVVIGGHLDSISPGKAPGADDNASGTATVMEAYRLIVKSGMRLNRTLQFMGYAGEEEGLLGSQDIATRYREEKKNVVGALQFDMTMYPGSNPRMTYITDYTNRDLNRYTERLSDEYVKALWIEDECGYACSDHASWTSAGYRSTFPFESAFGSDNPDIHTPRDTLDKLTPSHGLKYLKLALAFGVEMAEVTTPGYRRPASH
ncbi:MAG: M28 family peptidase [Cryobacterium sp.]|nr:M28 family peptidase [Oligoflexia bacterium]